MSHARVKKERCYVAHARVEMNGVRWHKLD